MAWKAQYAGPKSKHATVQLEAACAGDLYIWHSYFGMPGASNDLNVLASSPLAHDLDDGKFPPQRTRYSICGKEYYNPYLLCDGIYPNKPIYMKAFLSPVNDAEKSLLRCRKV